MKPKLIHITFLLLISNALIAQQTVIDSVLLKKATKLADQIMMIDCHSHDLLRPWPDGKIVQVNYPMIKTGRLKGIVQGFPSNKNNEGPISEIIINDINSYKREIVDSSRNVSIILKSQDFKNCQKNVKLAMLIGLESFKGLGEGNLNLLPEYYHAGVRMIGINQSGLDTIYKDNRLTKYGSDFLREVNRLGMICDITHIRRPLQNQIIEESEAPVIISHGGAFQLVNSVFNTPDTLLQKLAAKEGMIGITFYSGQLSKKSLTELDAKVDYDKISRATINEFVDHVDYLKNLVGIDHIGIGSDYGGSGSISPIGLETIEGFPLIIYHMLKRGYSESEIEKVMGLNFIRFFERVESKAAKSSTN